ncbi:MAG: transporter [Mariprofundales bacterium]
MSRHGVSICMMVAGLMNFSLQAEAGPITFNSALPVADGMTILRSQLKLLRKSTDTTAEGRVLHVTAEPVVLAYGATAKLALFGMLPYVEKRLDLTVGGRRIQRNARGLGDAQLFARYTIYQRDQPGDTLRIAPFAGLKVPTGSHNQRDPLGLIPAVLQPGSGSWDPFLGIAITHQTLDWEFDLAAKYRLNSRASDFTFGDQARTDASFQYRVLPRTLERSGVPAFVYAVLESNLIWNGKNRDATVTDPNSGGVTWRFAPGLQYVTDRFVLESAIQIPVVQKLNGTALQEDWIWMMGFRWNFFL